MSDTPIKTEQELVAEWKIAKHQLDEARKKERNAWQELQAERRRLYELNQPSLPLNN